MPIRSVTCDPPRGLTLVELLIVAAILTTVMGGLLVSLLTGRRSHVAGDAYVQVQQEARRAVDAMIKELRETNSSQMFLSGASTVVFQTPNDNDDDGSVATGGTLEWGAPDVEDGCIQYTLDGTQIERTLLAGPFDLGAETCGDQVAGTTARVLGNYVDALTFTAATGGLRVSVTTEITSQQLPGGEQRATISGRVQFRNL